MPRRHRETSPRNTLCGPATQIAVETAWLQTGRGRLGPQVVEVLKDDGKAGIYRLVGCDPDAGRGDVIAKRSTRQGLLVERHIYETVLQKLPERLAPRYFGSVDDEQFHWLFLQDVPGEPYLPDRYDHRCALARFLAELHGAAAGLDAVDSLPDQGTDSIRQHLEEAQRRIAAGQREARIDVASRQLLLELLQKLQILEDAWDDIAEPCRGLAQTLVHGDIEPRNLVVRPGAQVIAIDYEHAGRGIPALDLAGAIIQSGVGASPDLPAYAATARWFWPGLSDDQIQRLSELGTLFRLVVSIRWASHDLSHAWPERAMRRLRSYAPDLEVVIGTLLRRSIFEGAAHG